MESEERFWLGCWSLVAMVVGVIALAVMTSSMYEDAKVAEAIASGKDPVAVRCAFKASHKRTDAICTVYVTRR